MILFPNSKINLGLNITSKRSDGYHNIETAFYPIAWSDVLEIQPCADSSAKTVNFSQSGIKIYGEINQNLCVKAYQLIASQHPIDSVQIHLHKIVPIGAGLGGGSSDAAFTLLALNKLFNLNLSVSTLQNYASQLGSDCAFFIHNVPLLATGKGDAFKPIDLTLTNYHILVVKPKVSVSTVEAYKNIIPATPAMSIQNILKTPVSEWRNCLVNDFEKNVFKKYPSIEKIKDKLYKYGAIYASMSGSGSSVFGLFQNQPDMKTLFRGYTVWQGKL